MMFFEKLLRPIIKPWLFSLIFILIITILNNTEQYLIKFTLFDSINLFIIYDSGDLYIDECNDLCISMLNVYEGSATLTVGGKLDVPGMSVLMANTSLFVSSEDEITIAEGACLTADTIQLITGTDIWIHGIIDAPGTDSVVELNASGMIYMFYQTAEPIVADTLYAEAGFDILLWTDVDWLEANVLVSGTIEIYETDEIILNYVTNANGAIRVRADGTIKAKNVRSLCDAKWNNVVLLTTSGDILVDYIQAGWRKGQIILSSADDIIEVTPTDCQIDLKAHTLFLYAHDNIGGKNRCQHHRNLETASRKYYKDDGPNLTETCIYGHIELFFDVQGSIFIKARGEIRITNVKSHSKNIYIQSKNDSVSIEQISSIEKCHTDIKIYAKKDILLKDVRFTGEECYIKANNTITLNAGKNILTNSTINAGNDLHIRTYWGDIDIYEKISAGDDIYINSDDELIINADLTAGDDIIIKADDTITTNGNMSTNDYLCISGGGQVTLLGLTYAANTIDLYSYKDMILNTSLTADRDIEIFTCRGKLSIQSNSITAGDDIEICSYLDTSIEANLSAKDDINIRVCNSGDLFYSGIINADDDVTVKTCRGDMELYGAITAGDDIYIDSGNELIIDAGLTAGDDIIIRADDTITTNGNISTNDNLSISGCGYVTLTGLTYAAKTIDLYSYKDLILTTSLTADRDIKISTRRGKLSIQGNSITAGDDIEICSYLNTSIEASLLAKDDIIINSKAQMKL